MNNKDLPIGTKVKLINCPEAKKFNGKIWKTKSKVNNTIAGDYVYIEGMRRSVYVKCLQVVGC